MNLFYHDLCHSPGRINQHDLLEWFSLSTKISWCSERSIHLLSLWGNLSLSLICESWVWSPCPFQTGPCSHLFTKHWQGADGCRELGHRTSWSDYQTLIDLSLPMASEVHFISESCHPWSHRRWNGVSKYYNIVSGLTVKRQTRVRS